MKKKDIYRMAIYFMGDNRSENDVLCNNENVYSWKTGAVLILKP